MKNLVAEAEKYVISYLNDNLDTNFVYHNLAHTQRVVEKVNELINDSNLNENDQGVLQIAAWFHDTGFTKTIDNHEQESVSIASEFLNNQNVDPKHYQFNI